MFTIKNINKLLIEHCGLANVPEQLKSLDLWLCMVDTSHGSLFKKRRLQNHMMFHKNTKYYYSIFQINLTKRKNYLFDLRIISFSVLTIIKKDTVYIGYCMVILSCCYVYFMITG